jgi:hypothetical protein
MRLANRNTWKPTAHGRIDGVTGGSVVSVEFTRPDASWVAPAIVVIYALAFGAATFAYGGFPPADLFVGATAVAVFGVALGVIGPRIADHEQQEIETLLWDLLETSRGRE